MDQVVFDGVAQLKIMQDVGLVEMKLARRRLLSEQIVDRGQQISRALLRFEAGTVMR